MLDLLVSAAILLWAPANHLSQHGLDQIRLREGEPVAMRDIWDAERVVRAATHVPLTQAKFDALVSFEYNVGATRFRHSNVLAAVNNHGDVPSRLATYRLVRGRVSRGIIRRRQAEIAQWNAEYVDNARHDGRLASTGDSG